MIKVFALLLAGFSVFSAMSIALSLLMAEFYKDRQRVRAFAVLFLFALGLLQLGHFLSLYTGVNIIGHSLYSAILFAVAPLFYLFSEPLLKGRDEFSLRQLIHFIPSFVSLLLPGAVALALAFMLGALYLLRLAQGVYALRAQRDRFQLELSLLSAVFLIAIGVLVMVVFLPSLSDNMFIALYSIAIGLGFLLASVALAIAPTLPHKVAQVAHETYAVSTLNNIDSDALIAKFDRLMSQDKLYQDPDITLKRAAQKLGISGHQLSELLNQKVGRNFARFIREHRVMAARKMLLEAPQISVLSVGLSVGFGAESTFYDAFHEIVGTSPAKYRKLNHDLK